MIELSNNWLITGGCGFIGRNLITRLLADGNCGIRVVDNQYVGTFEDLVAITPDVITKVSLDTMTPPALGTCQMIDTDIRSAADAMLATKGMDVIVHLAACTGVAPSLEDPRFDCETNVFGTLNYLEAARMNGVANFIFASSGATVGEVEPPITEILPTRPVSPYGASKLAGEGYCSAYFRSFGVKTVALRFGNVYGPGSTHKASVVAKFIKRAISGEPIHIYGDGSQTRDFIYISDLVNAILRAAEAEQAGGEVFQIATSHETSVSAVTTVLLDILSRKGIANVEVHNEAVRAGDVKRNYADVSKAKSLLGWQAETTLEVGLAATIDFFLNNEQK